MNMRKKTTIISTLNATLIDLPAPSNITNMWNFGSMLGMCLGIQILSGIFLAMHYTSDILLAFNCISHISRDVDLGWFIRMTHANGASLFFLAMYMHIGRGLYFNSFILGTTWILGVMIFLISMMTAFLGYVLPWGQMSYWGATVITNLLSAVPYLGQFLVEWIWGGFSVNNATLTRFFSLHYLMPFVIAVLVMGHLIFLHEQKSSNPLGLQSPMDKIPFHPYFTLKDLTSMLSIVFIFLMVNMQLPFILMDPENFTPANPMSTPVHIQPEWYFLFAYTILRAIPNKLGGVIALLMSILILIPLPLKSQMKQFNKTWVTKPTTGFWFFIIFFLLLTWLGAKPVEPPYTSMGMILTAMYFLWFLAIMTN